MEREGRGEELRARLEEREGSCRSAASATESFLAGDDDGVANDGSRADGPYLCRRYLYQPFSLESRSREHR